MHTVPYAGFGARAGAAIIDGVLLSSVFYVLTVVIGVEAVARSPLFQRVAGTLDYQLAPLGSVLAGLFILLYKAVSESSHLGATPGKRVMKVEVMRTDGPRLELWRAALRSAPYWTPWMVPVASVQWIAWILALSSCVSVVTSKSQQGWHDRLVGAVVVHCGTARR